MKWQGHERSEALKWKEAEMNEAPCGTEKVASEKAGETAKSMTALR
jgi:hypothetical protein